MKQKLTIVLASMAVCLLGTSLAWGKGYNLDEYEKVTGKKIEAFHESPMLRVKVAAGELPPVEERLPENPFVQEPWEEIGKFGGTLELINNGGLLDWVNADNCVGSAPSPAIHPRYAYLGGEILPGFLESWEMSKDAKTWTFQIRKGLKWSDGVPVTTDDVRYAFEDVYFNKELYPARAFEFLEWGGERVKLEIVDDYTFRLTFGKPYGLFLPSPYFGFPPDLLMRPKHYLKQFHKKYTPLEELEPLMKEKGFSKEEWARFYLNMDPAGNWSSIYISNIAHPTLSPWILVDIPKPEEWVLERNPYYYKVDPQGNQLPYIDKMRVLTEIAQPEVVTMKILTGEVDVAGGFMTKLVDYPLYMKNREKGGYEVMLPRNSWDYPLIYALNLSPKDPVLRKIIQDIRFRQALSLALDREDFKESIFFGFGTPSQQSPLGASIFYEEKLANAYADYDPERANALLDEMDLNWDEKHEYRLRPDGEKLTLSYIYPPVNPLSTPGAELAKEYWEKIGIYVPLKLVDWALWNEIQGGNENVVCGWINMATVIPEWFIGGFMVVVPEWHDWYMTGGEKGTEPIPAAKRVYELRDVLYSTPSEEERLSAGKELHRLQAENLWVIGTVAEPPVPFIYSKKLGNISVAEEKNYDDQVIMEWAEQWFFKE